MRKSEHILETVLPRTVPVNASVESSRTVGSADLQEIRDWLETYKLDLVTQIG